MPAYVSQIKCWLYFAETFFLTQVAYIDVTSETPVDHGTVICFSIYGGPDLDFGLDKDSKSRNNQIWVDTYFTGKVILATEHLFLALCLPSQYCPKYIHHTSA